jgi:hypothetical protein
LRATEQPRIPTRRLSHMAIELIKKAWPLYLLALIIGMGQGW